MLDKVTIVISDNSLRNLALKLSLYIILLKINTIAVYLKNVLAVVL